MAWTVRTVLVLGLTLLMGPGPVAATPSAKASAKLAKPVALSINGGSCESDGKGTIGASFGNGLAFNIGPATVGARALHMSMAPYRGPGTYRGAMISGYPDKMHPFSGLGTVVVHADRSTGTFVTDDGTAAGTWNCGVVLK